MRTIGTAALLATLLALGSPARAAGLFEANHPKVKAGNEAFAQGDYEGALRNYEEAAKAMPRRPELQYNLGDVYMKLGRTDDAKRAFEAALAGATDELKARDLFNLGNAFSALNQTQDAIAAYRQALKVDPKHEPARRNLELLLRQAKQRPPQQPSPGDGGTPDSGQPDSGQPDAGPDGGSGDAGSPPDAGEDGGSGDAGVRDGGTDAGAADGGADAGQGDGGSDAGGASDGGMPTDGGSPDAGEPMDGGQGESDQADGGSPDAGQPDAGMQSQAEPEETSVDPEEIDRQKAEELLEALRRNEKQFLMHQQKRKGKTRVNPEKDW